MKTNNDEPLGLEFPMGENGADQLGLTPERMLSIITRMTELSEIHKNNGRMVSAILPTLTMRELVALVSLGLREIQRQLG